MTTMENMMTLSPQKVKQNGIPEHPDTREEVTQGLDFKAGDTAVLLAKRFFRFVTWGRSPLYPVRTSKYNFEVFLEVTSY